jgi:hypothetical protein
MRFCPFCAQELQDDAVHCAYCGKRLLQPGGQTQPAVRRGEARSGEGAARRPPVAPRDPTGPGKPEEAKRTVFGFAAPMNAPPPPLPPHPALTGQAPATTPPRRPAAPTGPERAVGAPPPVPPGVPRRPQPTGPTPPIRPQPTGPLASPPPRPQPATAPAATIVGAAARAPSVTGHRQVTAPGMLSPAALPRTIGPGTPPTRPPSAPAVAPTLIASTSGPAQQPQPPAPPPPAPVMPATVIGAAAPPSTLPPTPPPVPSDAALSPLEPVAAPAGEAPSAASAAAGLAPMPAHGPAGFFAGLPYWYKVIRARMKRSSVVAALKREQQAEERKLEECLRDLGKRARELSLGLPILELPFSELTALEGERGQLDGAKAELGTQLAAEKARFDEAGAECKVRIDEAQAQVQQLQGQLKERQDELRAVKQRLAELERQVKLETGQRDRRRAEAAKAKAPEQRQDLEQAAAEVAITIGDHEKQREAAQAEAASLDPPIAELQNELNEWRNRLVAGEKDLATARQALTAREKELGAQEQKLSGDLAQREQTIAAKFLEIGKILDGQRSPHRELAELYDRVDKTRLGIEQRGAQAARLEQDRDRYDRRAVKHGKIVFFSGLGLVVALIVFLIILFTVILAD